MARKTINVDELRRTVNERLATDESRTMAPIDDAVRQGICSLMEHILTTTGNYRGFAYVDGWPAAQANGTEHKRRYL